MSLSDEAYIHFVRWAKEQGVQINRIAPTRFPGRGLGVAATRKIKEGEVLVQVPISALLTAHVIPKGFKARHPNITIHGLLASFLALGDPQKLMRDDRPWRATWPTTSDFQESMPILWDPAANAGWFEPTTGEESRLSFSDCNAALPIPPAISGIFPDAQTHNDTYYSAGNGLLRKQEKKLKADFDIVKSSFPEADRETYEYYWLIVNTRSFYYVAPGGKPAPNHDDNMALCPFADLFNHANTGCPVTFDEDGFTIKADRSYAQGEEIYVSYGNHSNDFLLTEYGFMLETNTSDSLPVDDLIFNARGANFRKPVRDRLQRAGYLGNYTLTTDGFCHRSYVTARTQTLGYKQWMQFVEGKEFGGRSAQQTEDWLVKHVLLPYASSAVVALDRLDGLMKEQHPVSATGVFHKRWLEILEIVKTATQGRLSDRVARETDPELLERCGLSDETFWVRSIENGGQ